MNNDGLTVIIVAQIPATPGVGEYADCADIRQCADVNNGMIDFGTMDASDFLGRALEVTTYVHARADSAPHFPLPCCEQVRFNSLNHAVQCHTCGRTVDVAVHEQMIEA